MVYDLNKLYNCGYVILFLQCLFYLPLFFVASPNTLLNIFYFIILDSCFVFKFYDLVELFYQYNTSILNK